MPTRKKAIEKPAFCLSSITLRSENSRVVLFQFIYSMLSFDWQARPDLKKKAITIGHDKQFSVQVVLYVNIQCWRIWAKLRVNWKTRYCLSKTFCWCLLFTTQKWKMSRSLHIHMQSQKFPNSVRCYFSDEGTGKCFFLPLFTY